MNKPSDHHQTYSRRDSRVGASPGAVRTMLVDDSVVVRSIVERILADADDIEIVASCSGASEALQRLRSERVDVIVLDIEMPGMNGLAALPELIRKSDGARVLILSSNAADGGPRALEALSLGAADTLEKPGKGIFAGQFGNVLADRIVRLARDPGSKSTYSDLSTIPAKHVHEPKTIAQPAQFRCIMVGSSTGGINALNQLLKNLDGDVSSPILLTQHLPMAFIPFFASQLRNTTDRAVVVADDGMTLEENTLYIAPGHAHLTVAGRGVSGARIVLSSEHAASGCRPSADPMFRSGAEVFGKDALAIILSGMGRDGTDGAAVMKQRGGTVVAQSQESCVVWGMPGSIVNAGYADAVMDPLSAARFVNASSKIDRKPQGRAS